jgi:hypothetical protein
MFEYRYGLQSSESNIHVLTNHRAGLSEMKSRGNEYEQQEFTERIFSLQLFQSIRQIKYVDDNCFHVCDTTEISQEFSRDDFC